MKALCIPGTFCPKDYGITGSHQKVEQWTVLTFDDATAQRLASLYGPPVEPRAPSPAPQPGSGFHRGAEVPPRCADCFFDGCDYGRRDCACRCHREVPA